MNRLHNLPIRVKFTLALIPLIVIIISFDYLQIKENYTDYKDAQRLSRAILVGIEINHVVHELQKERGISTGLLSQRGRNFRKALEGQRRLSNDVIQKFRDEIAGKKLEELVSLHKEDLKMLNMHLDRIKEIRHQIDAEFITSSQAIAYYSEINEVALRTVNALINESRDRKAAEQVHAIIYFLKAKERASIERAIGTKAFSDGQMNNVTRRHFEALVAGQASYLDAFLTIADRESVTFYNSVVKGQDAVEVDRMRLKLFENENLDEVPDYWYEMITSKINMMKKVEDFMSDKIYEYTEQISSSAYKNLLAVLIIDMVIAIATFLLITFILSKLLKNVNTLEQFTRKVINGNLSQKVIINTKDELGHYADTFNLMIEQINKTQFALKRGKAQAQYLYENIYKQSQVVFQNVDQGIFLLNKEHKISKLYSRAMEKIFKTRKIAGETLVHFMQSLLIPRDLEALEMFIKHLFNPDIDESVVKQLNPVEKVKIYTESNGIVETKYVRLDFTRIENRKGIIRQVMVTVLDETRSVLLQQQIEEANEKKNIEMEQMLSILKVDPSLLRGFMFNTKKELKIISDKYEEHESSDYKELLTFTFQVVHGLKGNSIVIGLQMITDRFHKIEELIDNLKDKQQIEGNDFLTILYEINKVDMVIESMEDLLRKISNINNKFLGEEQTDANYSLIDTLKRWLLRMSEDGGKAVEFHFDNPENLSIPKLAQDAVKDIIIQLMRNSIVHGIEAPSLRIARKKLIKGKITVSLNRGSSDHIILSYEDDGNGLDTEEIIDKAIKSGLLSETQRNTTTREEVMELLFTDGFSTTDQANELSGRGHGMGLIRKRIVEIKGSFDITDEKGQYFKITIKIPTSQTVEMKES